MAVTTPFDYYSDESLWGGSQYMTLKEIIDAIVLRSMDDDDYLKNTKRSQIIMHAKNGIKKLTADVSGDILAPCLNPRIEQRDAASHAFRAELKHLIGIPVRGLFGRVDEGLELAERGQRGRVRFQLRM